MMILWIDGDACPAPVKEIVFKAGEKHGLYVQIVANHWQHRPRSPWIRLQVVPGGPDQADEYIVEHCQSGDLVITGDLPLADLLIQKQVYVITPYGEHLTEKNIGERLSLRHMAELRRQSQDFSGSKKETFSEKIKQTFASTFDRVFFLARSQNSKN